MQKNGQSKASRRKKTEQALELRLAGATYRNIAQAVGCSCSHAFRLVDAALRESAERFGEAAEKIRSIELARLDKMRMALWPKRSDPRACDSLLRISERTARLCGLDAPAKHEVTGADGGPVEVEQADSVPDLTRLSVEEIRQLATINKKLQGKG